MSQEYFVLFYFTFQACVRILTAFLAIFFCYSYTRLKRYDKGLAIYLKYDLLSIPWYICSQNTWNLKSKNFGNIYWAWKKKYQSQLAFKLNLFIFEHQSECSPYCSLNITYGADEENLVGDEFLYSPNLNVWFMGDTIWRRILVILWGWRINKPTKTWRKVEDREVFQLHLFAWNNIHFLEN